MDWFLYERDLRHKRVKLFRKFCKAGAISKPYLGPCQTSTMELFRENSLRFLNFFSTLNYYILFLFFFLKNYEPTLIFFVSDVFLI